MVRFIDYNTEKYDVCNTCTADFIFVWRFHSLREAFCSENQPLEAVAENQSQEGNGWF